jgi:hypothetical protein
MYKRINQIMTALLCCAAFLTVSCDKDKDDPKSAECDITSFIANGKPWNIDEQNNITYDFLAEAEEGELTPTIIMSAGATINPPADQAQNFFTANGVTYTVTAENGTTKQYKVKATRKQWDGYSIISFKTATSGADTVDWVVDTTRRTVIWTCPTDQDETAKLKPVVKVSPGADFTVEPAGDEKTVSDFMSDEGVAYTVTSEDGKKRTYTARIIRSLEGIRISSFKVGNVEYEIIGDSLITHIYPGGTLAEDLTPTITVPAADATVSPASEVPQNLFVSGGVTYTVTSRGGKASKTYTVEAKVGNSAAELISFRLESEEENWDMYGGIVTRTYDEEAAAAARGKAPIIEYSTGATISPEPGAYLDFFAAAGVTFTITSEDGTITNNYIVKAMSEISGDQCGPFASWSFDGVRLTIHGSGPMYDYMSDPQADPERRPRSFQLPPWYNIAYMIEEVVFEDGITYIGEDAFGWYTSWGGFQDNLKSVTLPNTLDSIGLFAFNNCGSLTTIDFPESLKVIGGAAFLNCRRLLHLNISENVTKIGGSAFWGCNSLMTVTIPASVTSIGEAAFGVCTALRTIYNYNPVPQELIGPRNFSAFQYTELDNITLYVPAGAVSAYQSANVWKDIPEIKAIEN